MKFTEEKSEFGVCLVSFVFVFRPMTGMRLDIGEVTLPLYGRDLCIMSQGFVLNPGGRLKRLDIQL